VLAAASAGVIVRPDGTAVAVGAIASLSRADAGSGVGAGILEDSKNLSGDAGSGLAAGPAASISGAASGVAAARDEESARSPVASDSGEARGVEAARDVEAASGKDGESGDDEASGVAATAGAEPATSVEAGTAWLRPHDWQLVCPRKTSVAPQNRHVGFCDPCPSVTLYLISAGHRAAALTARQYDRGKRGKDRPLGPNSRRGIERATFFVRRPAVFRIPGACLRRPQIDRPSACLPPEFGRPVVFARPGG
jgi:hypothetical protein